MPYIWILLGDIIDSLNTGLPEQILTFFMDKCVYLEQLSSANVNWNTDA